MAIQIPGGPNASSIVEILEMPIIAARAPNARDIGYDLGQVWIDSSSFSVYMLAGFDAGEPQWTTSPASGVGVFTEVEITGGVGDVFTIDAGDAVITSGDLTLAAGDLSVGGNVAVSGDVAITGDLTVDGAFSLIDTGQISLESSAAQADAILLNASDAAGGIKLEGGTGGFLAAFANGPVALTSGTGTVSISADATANTVNLGTGAGAKTVVVGSATTTSTTTIRSGSGGVALVAGAGGNGTVSLVSTGTGDITLDSDDTLLLDADGVLELNSSAGVISIGNDADAQNINVGTGAAARLITIGNVTTSTGLALNSGTGHITLTSTGTGDIILNSDDTMLLDADGVLELNSSAGVISIGNDADAQNINIGTGAAERIITIGNVSAASQVVINSGTAGVAINTTGAGDFVVTSADTVLVDAAGVLELNSSAGVIGIGNDAVAQNINIGTGAAARVITIGNVTTSTGLALNSGTGSITLTSTGSGDIVLDSDDTMLLDADGVLELNSSAGIISIGNDADALGINIGTAGVRPIVVGNATASTSLTLTAGTGATGLKLNAAGNVQVVPATSSTAAATSTVVMNNRVGVATFTGFTTASAASQAFTITNSTVLSTSGLLVTVTNLNPSTNAALMQIQGITQAAGSFVVSCKNVGGGALGTGDNVLISFWVIS